MLDEQRDVEIHWPDEFDEAKRAELRGVVLAYNDALTELEAGPAAVFSSDGERNGVFHSFLKRWDKAWSKPGPCMHMGCTNTSIPRSHTISLGTSIRLPEKGCTKLLLAAAKEHELAIDLHASDHGSFAVIEMLESWMIHGTDHWFITPSAWNRIPKKRQQAIRERLIEPLSLAERAPFSVLDDVRRHIVAVAESQVAAGKVASADLAAVKRAIAEQTAKLEWTA